MDRQWLRLAWPHRTAWRNRSWEYLATKSHVIDSSWRSNPGSDGSRAPEMQNDTKPSSFRPQVSWFPVVSWDRQGGHGGSKTRHREPTKRNATGSACRHCLSITQVAVAPVQGSKHHLSGKTRRMQSGRSKYDELSGLKFPTYLQISLDLGITWKLQGPPFSWTNQQDFGTTSVASSESLSPGGFSSSSSCASAGLPWLHPSPSGTPPSAEGGTSPSPGSSCTSCGSCCSSGAVIATWVSWKRATPTPVPCLIPRG